MKVVRSRKGFDSAFGGYPSPIIPSSEMVSLPIPFNDAIRYSDLSTSGSTYYDLMANLEPRIRRGNDGIVLSKRANVATVIHMGVAKKNCRYIERWEMAHRKIGGYEIRPIDIELGPQVEIHQIVNAAGIAAL